MALYTFHYVDDWTWSSRSYRRRAKRRQGAQERHDAGLTAMLLRPEELRDRLEVPLTATIPPRTPKTKEFTGDNPETKVCHALTTPNVFAVTFQQAQDAKTYLVLRRLPTP